MFRIHLLINQQSEDEVLFPSSTDLKNAKQKLAMLEDEQLKVCHYEL